MPELYVIIGVILLFIIIIVIFGSNIIKKKEYPKELISNEFIQNLSDNKYKNYTILNFLVLSQ